MPIRYRLLPGTAGKKLMTQAAKTPTFIKAFMGRTLASGTSNIQRDTPVGWSGQARNAWSWQLRAQAKPGSFVGTINNPTLYLDVLEKGRNPGKMPPIEALVPWVGSKLGIPPGPERRSVAFLVARKIGQEGTEGAHMIEKGWEETRQEIKPELKQLGLRIVGSAE